jgi:hypothetical protein
MCSYEATPTLQVVTWEIHTQTCEPDGPTSHDARVASRGFTKRAYRATLGEPIRVFL